MQARCLRYDRDAVLTFLTFQRFNLPERSAALCHDQIAFLVIPAITKTNSQSGRIALLEQFTQFRLIILLEELNWPQIGAEKAQVPFIGIEIVNRNSGIVLHDHVAVFEIEIPN